MKPTQTGLEAPQALRKPIRLMLLGPLAAAWILCAGVLALSLLLTGQNAVPTHTDEPARESSLVQLIPNEYGMPVSVCITGGAEAYTLMLEGDTFTLAGEDAALDTHAAREMLASGAAITARQKLAGAAADFGLGEGALQAAYTYANGSTLTLLLGHAVPTGEGWYAALAGDDAVYVVNNALAQLLQAGKQALYALPDLTERFTAQTLLSVRFDFPGEKPITIARVQKENPFNTMVELTQPVHYPANSERAAEVYLALEKIKPTAVADLHGDDSTWDLDEPLAVITLQDEKRTVLTIGSVGEVCTLRVDEEDAVYTLDQESVTFMQQLSVPYLAEQLPGLVMLNQVEAVSIRAGEEAWHFQVDHGAKSYLLDGAVVSQETFLPVYQQMIGLLIERYVEQPAEEMPLRAEILYTLKGGETFRLGFAAYNDQFDLIERAGCRQFLISRSKTNALLDRLRQIQPDK